MAKDQQGNAGAAGQQSQESLQSVHQGEPKPQSGKPTGSAPKRGIGSSLGQDRAGRGEGASERPSAGTADIERGSNSPDVERGGSNDSLVGDSVGAYKERP